MKKTLDLKTDVGCRVRIDELEQHAVVRGIMIEFSGVVSYKVEYFANGERHSAWLYEDEFEVWDSQPRRPSMQLAREL